MLAAVQTVPGVDAGGISRTHRGTVTSQHPTTEEVSKLDAFQSDLGEGPCVTAAVDPRA